MTAHDVCFSVHAVKDLFSETPYGEGKGEKTSFKCQVMLLIPSQPSTAVELETQTNQFHLYILTRSKQYTRTVTVINA